MQLTNDTVGVALSSILPKNGLPFLLISLALASAVQMSNMKIADHIWRSFLASVFAGVAICRAHQ